MPTKSMSSAFTLPGKDYRTLYMFNMFKKTKSDFLYPVLLYTLHDPLFIFYIFVVYYRIKKSLISTDWNIIGI